MNTFEGAVTPCVDCGTPVTIHPPSDAGTSWRCGRCGGTPLAQPSPTAYERGYRAGYAAYLDGLRTDLLARHGTVDPNQLRANQADPTVVTVAEIIADWAVTCVCRCTCGHAWGSHAYRARRAAECCYCGCQGHAGCDGKNCEKAAS